MKKSWIYGLLSFFLACGILLGGCAPGAASADAATEAPVGYRNGSLLSSPERVRDVVLVYLLQEDMRIPSPQVTWESERITSEYAIPVENFLYSYRNWTVSVVSPQVTLERKVYTVIVLNEESAYKWAGLVDAYGEIVRMSSLQSILRTPTATLIPTSPAFPTVTSRPITPTSTPIPCNDATFLENVTIPDDTTFTPGQEFLKIWRLRNVGSCTWTTEYDLIFVGGNRLGARRAIPLAETVKPGESVELGAYMVAPRASGDYRGFWMLRNNHGRRFGIGDDADDSFWVDIKVVKDENKYKYNFALEYYAAIWRSAANRLSCGDETDPRDGSVVFLISPELENRHENEPTLWLHPNEGRDGWIEGTYPAVPIAPGDHFETWVGCLVGYQLCDVTFYLSYIGEDNRIHTLGIWREVQDRRVTVIDIDLSNLAGQSVQFILGMETNNSNVGHAQGFWFVPRIHR